MKRDDVLRLQYFREYMATDHLDRIAIDDYVNHIAHERRDVHVASMKLQLKDELRAET